MKSKVIFEQLIRYFPEGQEARICSNICAFGEACLSVGDFENAVKYADMLLSQNCSETQRISAYRTKLFAKLKCRNINEAYHCKDFKRDMPEYNELILACSSNDDKLKLFAGLPKKNEQTVAADEERLRIAEEQRQRAEEEAEQRRIVAEEEQKQREREQAKAEERERRRREKEGRRRREEEERRARECEEEERLNKIRKRKIKLYFRAFASLCCCGVLLFLAAVILWIVFNATMPYKFPVLWLLFLLACISWAGMVVFGVLLFRAKGQDGDLQLGFSVKKWK